MTHGEAYWCVRRRNKDGKCDWLSASGWWGLWIDRARMSEPIVARRKATEMRADYRTHTFSVVRVTHRRKGT